MTDENIILNCLIVPIGKLINISYVKVIQVIAVHKYKGLNELQTAIQSRLETPFNNIPLKFCIIQTKNVVKKEMDRYNQISEIFTEKPKAEHFHITVYP